MTQIILNIHRRKNITDGNPIEFAKNYDDADPIDDAADSEHKKQKAVGDEVVEEGPTFSQVLQDMSILAADLRELTSEGPKELESVPPSSASSIVGEAQRLSKVEFSTNKGNHESPENDLLRTSSGEAFFNATTLLKPMLQEPESGSVLLPRVTAISWQEFEEKVYDILYSAVLPDPKRPIVTWLDQATACTVAGLLKGGDPLNPSKGSSEVLKGSPAMVLSRYGGWVMTIRRESINAFAAYYHRPSSNTNTLMKKVLEEQSYFLSF